MDDTNTTGGACANCGNTPCTCNSAPAAAPADGGAAPAGAPAGGDNSTPAA